MGNALETVRLLVVGPALTAREQQQVACTAVLIDGWAVTKRDGCTDWLGEVRCTNRVCLLLHVVPPEQATSPTSLCQFQDHEDSQCVESEQRDTPLGSRTLQNQRQIRWAWRKGASRCSCGPT